MAKSKAAGKTPVKKAAKGPKPKRGANKKSGANAKNTAKATSNTPKVWDVLVVERLVTKRLRVVRAEDPWKAFEQLLVLRFVGLTSGE